MKYLLTIFLFGTIFCLYSCSKSEVVNPVVPPVNNAFDVSKATLIKQGTFGGNMSYKVTGSVKLYEWEGKKYIYFENFSASSGPDLKVYVATTNTAAQFVSLGAIKSTTGTQLYEVSNPPNFSQYNKVLIWCQQFSVLFGSAAIQ